MDLSPHILGSGVVKSLSERAAAPILRIGSDHFDRRVLAAVACFNFNAAAILSRLLNEHLQVKNTRDVFDRIPPSALAMPGLGSISLAVLGAAFEHKGIGGEHPLEAWVIKHRPPEQRGFLLFTTLKHKLDTDARAAADAKRSRRRRRS